jgi:aryl-alcohol dehydrogenase-like predicted oxidoreductase
LALNRVISQREVSVAISGSDTLEQLDDNPEPRSDG